MRTTNEGKFLCVGENSPSVFVGSSLVEVSFVQSLRRLVISFSCIKLSRQ